MERRILHSLLMASIIFGVYGFLPPSPKSSPFTHPQIIMMSSKGAFSFMDAFKPREQLKEEDIMKFIDKALEDLHEKENEVQIEKLESELQARKDAEETFMAKIANFEQRIEQKEEQLFEKDSEIERLQHLLDCQNSAVSKAAEEERLKLVHDYEIKLLAKDHIVEALQFKIKEAKKRVMDLLEKTETCEF